MITRNAAQCVRCGDTIESKHRHDFQSCSCGAIFVDGGLEYVRRGGNPEDFRDLSSGERCVIRNDGSGSVSGGYERAHDPRCPSLLPFNTLEGWPCQCKLIATVRKDERANIKAEWAELLRERGDATLADLRALRDQS